MKRTTWIPRSDRRTVHCTHPTVLYVTLLTVKAETEIGQETGALAPLARAWNGEKPRSGDRGYQDRCDSHFLPDFYVSVRNLDWTVLKTNKSAIAHR